MMHVVYKHVAWMHQAGTLSRPPDPGGDMVDLNALGTAPKQVETSAGPIRYRERGSGPTLLFLHGIVANGVLWRRIVPALADDFRCITPDWPLGSHELGLRGDAD